MQNDVRAGDESVSVDVSRCYYLNIEFRVFSLASPSRSLILRLCRLRYIHSHVCHANITNVVSGKVTAQ